MFGAENMKHIYNGC